MNSVLTNVGAMVALETLRRTDKALNVTQGRIASGLEVASADQNAATYAVAATMRSDAAGFETIQEGLSVAESAVSVGRSASESIGGLLERIKEKIVAAQDGTVDRTKLQADIDQLRDQIKSIGDTASFNGLNYLKDGEPVEILSALNRATEDGAHYTVTTDTIAFDRQGLVSGEVKPDPITVAAGSPVAPVTPTMVEFGFPALKPGDAIPADVRFDRVTLTRGDGAQAVIEPLAHHDTMSGLAADVATRLGAGYAASWDGANGKLTVTDALGRGLSLKFEGEGGGKLARLDPLDVTSDEGAKAALGRIETMIQGALGSAAALGATQTRLSTQKEFLGKLVDAVETGVGALVDADMTQESARLQSLQVQQQLAAQGLGIANQQPQQLLGLFKS